MTERPSDEDIRRTAIAALAGDRSARDDIARYVTAVAWPIICEDVVQAVDRDDVLQHVLMDVDRAIGKLTGAAAGPQTGFIRLIAERRAIDWMRRKAREQRVSRGLVRTPDDSIAARAPQPERTLEHNELVQLIRGRASEKDREIIDLFLAGFSNAEIAERLGMHPGTVTRHFKAIRELNRDLGGGAPAAGREDEPPSG